LPEKEYYSTTILTYYLQKYALHFVWIGWEIIDWASANQSELSKVHFFGIETYCLNNPHILKTLKMERYHNINNEKKQLCDSDFIERVLPSIQAATQFNFEITQNQIT
jgi:hypothetical protein